MQDRCFLCSLKSILIFIEKWAFDEKRRENKKNRRNDKKINCGKKETSN